MTPIPPISKLASPSTPYFFLPHLSSLPSTSGALGCCFTLRPSLSYPSYGANVYPSPPAKSFFELYIGGFDDLAVQILSGAAVVALVGGIIQETTGGEKNGWIDGVAILVAVLLVTIVGVRSLLPMFKSL